MKQQNHTGMSFFEGLRSDSQEALIAASTPVSYFRKKEQLFYFGSSHILIIESGNFMTIRNEFHDRQQGVDILRCGDLLGIIQLFNSDYNNPITILPLSDVSGRLLTVNSMQQLIKSHDDIAEQVIKQFSQRYSRVVKHLAILAGGTSKERLEYSLETMLSLGLRQFTHHELALFSGMNRVTVTKNIGEAMQKCNASSNLLPPY